MVGGTLYKRGLSTPLLRYLWKAEDDYTLLKVHEGIVGKHPGARALTKKVLRAR